MKKIKEFFTIYKNRIIDFLKIHKKKDPLELKYSDREKGIVIQQSFVNQFAENQNHQQRLFIQFLSSVLVVIVAYAFVYSNTASKHGINIHSHLKTDSTITKELVINIQPEKFDSSKYDNGSIISYSQLSLISIYLFAQIVLLILSIMILHMGYSFRRDQAVVNRIRRINLGQNTYDKIFGQSNFKGVGKGFFEYLPNFNSILFFSICIIQCVLFASIFIYFKDFGDEKFWTIDNTNLLPNYDIYYKELRTSLVFPVLFNIFSYTYYYNKYEFTVNHRDTYVPVIMKLENTWKGTWLYIFVITLCAGILVYCFYKIDKIIHLWTFVYFYIIILLPIIFYSFFRKSKYAATYSQAFQGLVYIVFGTMLLYHSCYYFNRHTSYSMRGNIADILFTGISVLVFAIVNNIGTITKESDYLTLAKYLKGYNRFLFVMFYAFIIDSFLKLKWFDYSVACFFGLYSILIGRRTIIKWRAGEYDSPVEQYLEITGQSFQELFSGVIQYGPAYIDELVVKALKQKKKIIFKPELTNGQNPGLGRYELVDL